MSEKRLQEIKDSIDFQLRVCKAMNYVSEPILEEKELYLYVIELKEKIDWVIKYCNNNIAETPRLVDIIDILKEK